MPISSVLIIGVVLVLYIRSLKATKRERCNVLHLFLTIPKKAVLSTLRLYSKEDDDLDADLRVF